MAKRRDLIKNEIVDLVTSGDCIITQIIGNGAEEAYEGCERNILTAIDDEFTTIEKLPEGYMVSYETIFGVCQIIIKEC